MKARTRDACVRCGWVSLTLLLILFATGAGRPKPAATLLNRAAPEFSRRDLNGQRVDLAGLRGNVVLLNFWATWCAPCEAEIPIFSKWQQKYAASGLRIIGISMDDGDLPARKMVARLKPDYPIVMGDAKLGRRYGGVLGLPLTLLIDRKGIVRAQFQGVVDLQAMERRMQQMLRTP